MMPHWAIWTGVLSLLALPAVGAPVCISNHTDQTLVMVVDSLAGQRLVKTTGPSATLCMPVADSLTKASVGVFASEDAEEGCSRLAHPGQTETLIGFAEFDNCKWAPTPRDF